MAKETLLNSDVAFGERVLKALDTAGFPVPVALWLRKGDDETMKLLLASPLYDKLGIREAYLKLLGALSGEKDRSRFSFRLTGTRDPLIRDLRKVYGKTSDADGMRLRSATLGGVWIDEGYVYRIR
jgi:hypothetical protein